MTIPMQLHAENDELAMDVQDLVQVAAGDDYNALKNKPTLNGAVIQGAMQEKDPTVPDWAKTRTRPVYTAQDVGALGVEDVAELSLAALEQLWDTI